MLVPAGRRRNQEAGCPVNLKNRWRATRGPGTKKNTDFYNGSESLHAYSKYQCHMLVFTKFTTGVGFSYEARVRRHPSDGRCTSPAGCETRCLICNLFTVLLDPATACLPVQPWRSDARSPASILN
jgi:hypothetical protein